jgi:hypothetical protein
MKNKLLLGALLIGIASIFTSCKDDREYNPTIQMPTTFTLNTPAATDQYIQLSGDNTVHLTWSQPNYGYNAYVTYNVQVGLAQSDGSIKWCQKDIKDDNGNVIGKEDDYLSTNFFECNADISAEEIAMAINQIDGFTKIEDYVDQGFRKIAFRVKAAIYEALTDLVPGSVIVSDNVVYLNYVRAYAAIKSPAFIYIVGNLNDWIAPNTGNAEALADWRLYETDFGNQVFEGTFDLPSGMLQFRFYTYLDDWGSDEDPKGSMGTQLSDKPIDCEWGADNSYTDSNLQPGRGTWKFGSFAGGKTTFTVDMNTKSVKFSYVPNE